MGVGITILTMLLVGSLRYGGHRPVKPVGSVLPPELSITAVGDLVMHLPVVNSAYNRQNGEFDFRPIFSEIRPWLSRADIAVGVLEAPLSGPERQYSGYPRFNSPYAIADAVKWAGLDLVFTAHNHAMDQGRDGLLKTLAYYDKIGLRHTGCRSRADQPNYLLYDCQGMRLAFLSYTTTTNGIPLPVGAKWLVNTYDEQSLGQTVRSAREAGADAVILAFHSGVEYQRKPPPEQQRLLKQLLKLGVDIILGSHVHVIEPVEWQAIRSGNRTRQCFIAYSLGNFLSNQQWRYSDCGLTVNLRLRKDPAVAHGVTIVAETHYPVWVRRDRTDDGRSRYRIERLTEPEPVVPATVGFERKRREVWEDTFELLKDWQPSNQ